MCSARYKLERFLGITLAMQQKMDFVQVVNGVHTLLYVASHSSNLREGVELQENIICRNCSVTHSPFIRGNCGPANCVSTQQWREL